MARLLIREAHGGETRIIRDGALPYFLNQGYVVLDTLDDDTDASPVYLSAAEGDLRWAKIADLGNPASAEVAVISEVVADSLGAGVKKTYESQAAAAVGLANNEFADGDLILITG